MDTDTVILVEIVLINTPTAITTKLDDLRIAFFKSNHLPLKFKTHREFDLK